MNEPTVIEKENKNITRKLDILSSKHTIVSQLVDKAFWINQEKRDAIKMMIDIFMEFAQELAKKKGVR